MTQRTVRSNVVGERRLLTTTWRLATSTGARVNIIRMPDIPITSFSNSKKTQLILIMEIQRLSHVGNGPNEAMFT